MPIRKNSSDTKVSPLQLIQQPEHIEDDNIEDEDENNIQPEDEVLDAVDVDDGVPNEERSDEGWTLSDFQNEEDLPDFDSYYGVNTAFMRSSNCLTCLDSFACFFDDNVMHAFLTASHNWGQKNFPSNWKPFTVNELKAFLAIILVLGLIPVSSRESVWDDNGLGIPFIKRIMSKARFNQLLRAWRYNDESGLTDEKLKSIPKIALSGMLRVLLRHCVKSFKKCTCQDKTLISTSNDTLER